MRMPGATAYTSRYNRAAKGMTAAGVLTGRRWRAAAATAGALLLAGSAATRFAIFHAGVGSAEDPKDTVIPQRQRLEARAAAGEAAAGS